VDRQHEWEMEVPEAAHLLLPFDVPGLQTHQLEFIPAKALVVGSAVIGTAQEPDILRGVRT